MPDWTDTGHSARWRRGFIAAWVALTLLAAPCFVVCDGGGEHAVIEPVFATCCSPTLRAGLETPASAESAGAGAGCTDDCIDTLLASHWAAVEKSNRFATGPAPRLLSALATPNADSFDRLALRAGALAVPAAASPAFAVLRL